MTDCKSRIARGCLAALLVSPIAGQGTQRVNVGPGGVEADAPSDGPSISADARYVAFSSFATNLVPGDTNGAADVFVRDLQNGTTELVSVSTGGAPGNSHSDRPSISADGRYVAFISQSTNFDAGDTNGFTDVFVRNRLSATTERVSVALAGAQENDWSFSTSITPDGRFVAFGSYASNLVAGDLNGDADVFVRDRLVGTTARVSIAENEDEGNNPSYSGAISADGRYVAFWSNTTWLVPGDTNGNWDVFVRDRQDLTTERVSVATDGTQSLGPDSFGTIAISADGRFVAFTCHSGNLVPGDTNGLADAFVRDRLLGTTERVSVNSGEGEAWGGPSSVLSISGDGRLVAFYSQAANLVPGDTNGFEDVFVRDRQQGTTERVSVDSSGAQADAPTAESGSLTADGRWLAFGSWATNLVSGDTNSNRDVFVRDLDTTAFTSLCDPGYGGVVGCPCANPGAGPTRGCDNSSATGGAALSATGDAHLSGDTLVFLAVGEKPTALSIVLQGNAFVAGGVVYGQGMRCVGGALKRLYSKGAEGGSITAPDFGAGDLSVSAQSASKGDVILPGQPRWYIVYYRDPTVLGGCPDSSTFNATQTGQVSWSL
jgi:Tol biopolymer transport system component